MPNPLKRVKVLKMVMRGKSLAQVFPNIFLDINPYSIAVKGGCLVCGGDLGEKKVFFRSRMAEKTVHQRCYNNWGVFVEENEVCIICGDYLDDGKMNQYGRDPGEVSNRIHDGRCLDYFCILSCKALGYDMNWLVDEHVTAFLDFVLNKEFKKYETGESPESMPHQSPSQYVGLRDLGKGLIGAMTEISH